MTKLSKAYFEIVATMLFLHYFNSYPIYPTPPLGQDMTQGQFLSGV